jgi:ADP-ribose pyrophosphatase YjhB (NUDIX family)
MDVESAEHGFGLFGEDFGYPGGGLCLSVFLAVRHEGQLLVGRMSADHDQRWTERWAPNLAYYDEPRRSALFEGWRFPATYLQVGEAPEAAAGRVWRDQLGFAAEPDLGDVRVSSSSQPSRRSPEHEHWDVVFAYDVDAPGLEGRPEHWAELAYRDPASLDADDAVLMHGELVDWLA